jgi:hypothetical protein
LAGAAFADAACSEEVVILLSGVDLVMKGEGEKQERLRRVIVNLLKD